MWSGLYEYSTHYYIIGNRTRGLSYAHAEHDIDQILKAYDKTLAVISEMIRTQSFDTVFKGKCAQAFFDVRGG